MKLTLIIIFWSIIGYLLYQFWGWNAVLIELAFVVLVNIVALSKEKERNKE